jgi:acyl dehydratase
VTVEVERGRIRFFAKVLGETDPVHHDVAAARAAGHPDLVAPASYFMVLQALANEELARRGEPGANQIVGCDVRYLLHGDETFRYRGLVYAGDALEMTTTVVDFFDRKNGALEFVTLRLEARHAERGVLIESNRTLLHRLG